MRTSPLKATLPRLLILLIAAAAICFHCYRVLETAWISDDAYITYRTVDNAVNGYGLRFNPAERVQSYTHPLWMLLHIPVHALIPGMYFAGMFVTLATSLAALFFACFKIARTPLGIAFVAGATCLSPSFLDYSTSGLENPMTHLLLGLFFWLWVDRESSRRRLLGLSLVTGLLLLNRMDTLLLVGPALGLEFWRMRSRGNAWTVVKGLSPFILWELFSLFYYGFPFPNTAYAKLNVGLSGAMLAERGLWYMLNGVLRDPVCFGVIVLAIGLTVLQRQWRFFPLILGVVLYLAYSVKIGGDFMSGRFFTAPFFLALLILARLDTARLLAPSNLVLTSVTTLLVIGLMTRDPYAVLGQVAPDVPIDSHGIADERSFYYDGTGLMNYVPGKPWPTFRWVRSGQEIAASADSIHNCINIGIIGYYAGPRKHLLDLYALGNPFLARLPSLYRPDWRPGHFERLQPPGYFETVKTGHNQFKDQALWPLYEDLQLVTQGPLWSWKRMQAIWRVNFKDYHIDRQRYHMPQSKTLSLAGAGPIPPDPGPWDSPENHLLGVDEGLAIPLDGFRARTLRMAVRCGLCYVVVFLEDGKVRHSFRSCPGEGMEMKVMTHEFSPEEFPEGIPADKLVIYPLGGWPVASIGGVELDPA